VTVAERQSASSCLSCVQLDASDASPKAARRLRMRTAGIVLLIGIAATGVAAGGGRAAPNVPCVPTEAMPVLGSHGPPADHMPILRTDTARLDRMPVATLRACSLVDGARVTSSR